MAFTYSTLWSFVYRLPVDGFRYLHTMMISGAPDQQTALSEFYHSHTNPDAEIVGFKNIASPVEHAEIVAKVLKDSGGEHRDVQPGEAHLTIQQVKDLGGPAIAATPGELLVPTAEQVEAIRKSKGL